MAEVGPEVEPGVCLAFGGTNARIAGCEDGDIYNFNIVPTPKQPKAFYEWMARKLLLASHAGNEWMVAGFPGLVSEDGQFVGPMQNVRGMAKRKFNLIEKLSAADPEVERVISQGFVLRAVNDGTLSAHAAASHISEFEDETIASLIIGTGVGTGVVEKDPNYSNVYRTDNKKPYEIGHVPLKYPLSYEQLISGPALERLHGYAPKDLILGSRAWREVSEAIVGISVTLGLLEGVNLVVPCGGVGSGAANKYQNVLDLEVKKFLRIANQAQKEKFPEIIPVPQAECDYFEMFGAEGVMREHLTATL
jgi:predicted NBD/HSP70 family sugar kinase